MPLAPLTLLAGANASGKSSVLQALVLLHQTMREHEWSTRLMLNGKSIKLGTVSDVVDKVNGRDLLEIGIVTDGQTITWTFEEERAAMSMQVKSIGIGEEKFPSLPLLRFLLPSTHENINLATPLHNLTYITAERIGPREFYVLEDRQTASVVGTTGEHAVSVLHWGRDEPVLKGLVIEGTANTRLRQVEEYMQWFFPGCALNLQLVAQANAVTLGIRTSNDTDFHRPIHVGFGLTQVLPIIIAVLSAQENDILLIENPEVHLHPAGQARMGQFLAKAANAGVQVILETHSDHILNGIRRAVKSGQIGHEKVAIHFFRPRSEQGAQVISPILDSNGNINHWPENFFDQFDKDSNYFAGWGE
ncbi:DUF3696 domain-containing protein [Methylovulum psychrotolerans]|uniref:DUF3696 domain-containing protein n=1 Tax=Methylovulum psychrotolerans TaxID=1704499 RepID=UPI001BFFC0FE|nr:DUF3696 domain-containing protein [Methylovulum psychrotolerans]